MHAAVPFLVTFSRQYLTSEDVVQQQRIVRKRVMVVSNPDPSDSDGEADVKLPQEEKDDGHVSTFVVYSHLVRPWDSVINAGFIFNSGARETGYTTHLRTHHHHYHVSSKNGEIKTTHPRPDACWMREPVFSAKVHTKSAHTSQVAQLTFFLHLRHLFKSAAE